jgi:hypothetical protein
MPAPSVNHIKRTMYFLGDKTGKKSANKSGGDFVV